MHAQSTSSASYVAKRGKVKDYFDVTAADTWAKLTSDAPVSRIRATVRAGRDQMRSTLLSWLPNDLSNTRILDAGCGTGSFAIEAAKRGAHVVAVDLSPTLVELAKERLPSEFLDSGTRANGVKHGHVELHAGDLLDPTLGSFDFVVSMDCLIHYSVADATNVLAKLAERTSRAMLFTFAPSSPLLMAMHTAGQLFPRKDRSPAIEPVKESRLRELCGQDLRLKHWQFARSHRVSSGFYTSQAMELVKS